MGEPSTQPDRQEEVFLRQIEALEQIAENTAGLLEILRRVDRVRTFPVVMEDQPNG